MSELSPLKRAYLALEEAEKRIAELEEERYEPLAIVAIGCRFPGGANDPESFWRILHEGRETITEIPANRWDTEALYDPDFQARGKMSTRWGAFVDQVDAADPAFFDVSPREMASMDPQQRLLMEVAWEALERGGRAGRDLRGSATGVFVGVSSHDYGQLQLDHSGMAGIDTYYASGIAQSMASGRLSFLFGLQGPALSVDTACSSSLVAVHLACKSLRARECDMALAGGVNLMVTPHNWIALSKYQMMAPDGTVKAFDERADGFVRGEGCGMLLLRRLSDAVDDNDPIVAVIRGTALNQDGPSSGLTAPNGPAQEAVIRAALEDADVAAEEVAFVEAHGTGTALGDPIEVRALGNTYGAARKMGDPITIGSLKPNVGHLEGAAGIVGLIKAALVLQHGEIPAQLHLESPNPLIPWERSNVRPVRDREPLAPVGDTPYAGVSSFGFSGTNSHAILERAPRVERETSDRRPRHLLHLSAKSDAALGELAGRLAPALSGENVGDLCYTANAGRAELDEALYVHGDAQEIRAALETVATGETPRGALRAVRASEPAKLAFLFTGQGSQSPGMARDLYETQPVYREVVDRADAILAEPLGRSIRELLLGDDEAIHQTALTQPSLYVLEVALAELWRSWGIVPGAVLGHSVGEYVAATVAGILGFEEGLRLIATRARLMQALPAGGGMATVFADEATVAEALEPYSGKLAPAAINGPRHVVVSGELGALEELRASLKSRKITSKPLRVSHAFHSPLMEPMLAEFEREAAKVAFGKPKLRLVANVTAEIARGDALGRADYWTRHLREPVRFASSMRRLHEEGFATFVEVGPHPVLLGMGKDCLPEGEGRWLPSLRRGKPSWPQLLETLGQLGAAGIPIDWEGFDAPYGRARIALPTYPFQRKRYWIEGSGDRDWSPPERGEASGHPLLGRGVPTPLDVELHDRAIDGKLALIDDHRVNGAAILPATGFLEMAFAVAAERFEGPVQLDDVVINEALVLGDRERRLQLLLREKGPRRWAWEIQSRDAEAGRWTLHASGELSPAGGTVEAVDLTSMRKRCTQQRSHDEHHARLREGRLDFGPSLGGLQEVSYGPGEALAEIAQNDAAALDADRYRIHPALLDACLQAMDAARPERPERDLFVPVAIDRVVMHAPIGTRMLSHARIDGDGAGETLRGDVTVVDLDGAPLIELCGIRLKKLEGEALARLATGDADDWLYVTDWPERPRKQAAVAPIDDLAEFGAARFTALASEHGLERMDPHVAAMEATAQGFMLRALDALGIPLKRGSRIEPAKLRIAESGLRPLGRICQWLAGAGLLEGDSGSASGSFDVREAVWSVAGDHALPDEGELLKALAERAAALPACAAETRLLERCGPRLADVLRGTADPLELLFPEADAAAAAALYRETPVARTYSTLAADALVEAIGRRAEGDRPLSIVEIGAGTGGLTGFVLPALPPEAVERYVFTDISTLFAHQARERFGGYPFLEARPLDIEQDPREQGFEPGSFDVVIAANSLHATTDLARTFEHARSLLAPGGMLLLLEMTRPLGWIDVTFGLTDGWWLFTDTDLRRDSPLMTLPQWIDFLGDAGFEGVTGLPSADHAGIQSAIVAHAPQRPAARGEWLVVGDGIASALSARGANALSGGADRLGEREWDGVVLVDGDLRTALELVQGCARLERPPALTFLTRGAQQVGAEAPDPDAAALWGLARVARIEHPELSLRAIDCDPALPFASAVDELLLPDAEVEIALRSGRRHAARLARHVPRRFAWPDGFDADTPFRLLSTERGTLDALRFSRLDLPEPRRGEVALRVEATGLNFKDVLNALGAVEGDPRPPGGECAATVVAVGEGVEDLSIGDRVISVVSGCLASHVVAPAALTVKRPRGLGVEQAATIAIPYVTAALTLGELGKLGKGRRVLIHAGAGGVGLAAVHLALRSGAEIFATAGSPSKRDYLRSLGVPHVMSSRTLDFKDEILRLTDGRGVDVVLNSLADDFIPASLALVEAGGTFIELGKKGLLGPDEVGEVDYHVIDWSVDAEREPERVGAVLGDVVERVGRGELPALPVERFGIAEAVDAFRHMAQAKHTGKIAIVQPGAAFAPREDRSYVIVGGLGGLGRATARLLLDEGAGHVALVGRSGGETSLERTSTHACDVSDRDALARVLQSVRATAPIGGIFQSAGRLDDGALLQQDWSRFETVLGPKVHGSRHLDELTADDPLDAFVLYSSIASLLGSAGQANHAAANAWMDALAQRRRAQGRPALSIGWGAWSEIGAAAERGVDRAALERGLGVIRPDAGIAVLERLLESAPPYVGVVPIDWPAFLAGQSAPIAWEKFATSTPVARPQPSGVPAASGAFLAGLESAPPARREAMLADLVAARVGELLALDGPADPVKPLGDQGVDSLMAVELRNDLKKQLDLDALPATLVFDHPSVEAIARFLLEEVLALDAPEQASETADPLAAIEDLSDEEVERLLAEAEQQGKG